MRDDPSTAINVNDSVWVRLTDEGWAVHYRFHRFHRDLNLDPAPYRAALGENRSGWQRFQLWTLMEIFGPETHMGMPGPHFEGNVVHLTDPAGNGSDRADGAS